MHDWMYIVLTPFLAPYLPVFIAIAAGVLVVVLATIIMIVQNAKMRRGQQRKEER